MIDFYNAFISYKHAPLDIKIASHVQKELEHFHVPHNLKGKIKHKKITRIFRDKDELPITSDLTETLTNALRDSEHLIVICSTNTKESMWVKREIATFLQTHTKDKIFTVLCDGEPQDVIPEELLTADKEIVDANGFTHTVKIPVEPLSCDYRMPMGRADKEELPRLAAGLLGCSYDELQRRNRQYRMRRAAAVIAAAFAGVIAFGTYAFISRQQINKNYNEALRNRSIFLATESSQLLNEGKRVDAVQLALAALPKDKRDKMPATGAAMRAIINSTHAYRTSQGMGFIPIWNYKTSHAIELARVSDNQQHIAALDMMGNAYCWDVDSRELVFEKTVDNTPISMEFLDNDTLLLVYSDRIEAYNVVTRKDIWKFKDIKDGFSLTENRVKCAANNVYLVAGNGLIKKVSGRDGKEMASFEVESDDVIKNISKLSVSPNGKTIAYSDSSSYSGDLKVYTYDTEAKQEYCEKVNAKTIQDLNFVDDNHLAVISNEEWISASTMDYGYFKYLDTGVMLCSCFDARMKSLWSVNLEYNSVPKTIGSMALPKREAVLFCAGSTALVCDINSGKLINNLKTSSSIVTFADTAKNGLPEFICESGDYLFQVSADKNALGSMEYECNNVDFGFISDGIYIVTRNSTDIIYFNQFLVDDEWEQVKTPGGYISGTNYQRYANNDDYLVIAGKMHDEDIVRISIVNLETGKLDATEDVNVESGMTFFEVEVVDGDFYALIGKKAYKIDPKKKSVKELKIDLEDVDRYSNGCLLSFDHDLSDDTVTIEITDITNGKSKEIKTKSLKNIQGFYVREAIYLPAQEKIFFDIDSHVFAADMKSSKIEEIKLPDNWLVGSLTHLYASASDDGSKFVFSDRHTILVTDSSYKELYTLSIDCEYRCGTVFKEGILYVAADNYLGVFNAETGESINRYEMTAGIGEATFVFDDKKKELMVISEEQICLFDTESWVEMVSLENTYCYAACSDRFYNFSFKTTSQCVLGYFNHYSLEDLIAKANSYLGNREVDPIMKSKYGL